MTNSFILLLARALVWILHVSRSGSVGDGNLARQQSLSDNRRLLFQRLTSMMLPESEKSPYDPEDARRLAKHNAVEDVHETYLVH